MNSYSVEAFLDSVYVRSHSVETVRTYRGGVKRFGVISSDKRWHQVHVSGHGDGEQIKRVIEGSNAKKIIPIHTDPKNEKYHKNWHQNVESVNKNDSVKV